MRKMVVALLTCLAGCEASPSGTVVEPNRWPCTMLWVDRDGGLLVRVELPREGSLERRGMGALGDVEVHARAMGQQNGLDRYDIHLIHGDEPISGAIEWAVSFLRHERGADLYKLRSTERRPDGTSQTARIDLEYLGREQSIFLDATREVRMLPADLE